MSGELIENLRALSDEMTGDYDGEHDAWAKRVDEAADEITRLRGEADVIGRLVRALEQIAQFASERSNKDGGRTFTRVCHPALSHIEDIARQALASLPSAVKKP